MKSKACYTINREKGVFRIFNYGGYDYPLEMVKEWKEDHDVTWDKVANLLLVQIENAIGS